MKRFYFFLLVCICLAAGCREFRQADSDSFSMGSGEETRVLAEPDGEGSVASAGHSETGPGPAQRQESSLTEEKEISSSAQAGSSGGDFSPASQESSPAAEIPSPLSVSPGETVEEAWIEEDRGSCFTSSAIEDAVWERIRGVSYPEDCPLSLDDLRYLRLLHWDFDGNIRVGEMIVNREIEEAVLEIFEELFESGYPIEKIRLIVWRGR